MKRRDFLTLSGLALGSILIPSQVAGLIRETCIENEKPLLITPRSSRSILYAVDDCGSYTFHFGDPYKEPDPPTRARTSPTSRPPTIPRSPASSTGSTSLARESRSGSTITKERPRTLHDLPIQLL
jgi:hypothetical protein